MEEYSAARSGTPWTASQESSAPPIRLPLSFGETRTVYAGCPATSVGVAPDTSACLESLAMPSSIFATLGGSWSLACACRAVDDVVESIRRADFVPWFRRRLVGGGV